MHSVAGQEQACDRFQETIHLEIHLQATHVCACVRVKIYAPSSQTKSEHAEGFFWRVSILHPSAVVWSQLRDVEKRGDGEESARQRNSEGVEGVTGVRE